MAAVDDAGQNAALPFRVYGLEGQVKTQDSAITRLRESAARSSQAISAQAVTLAKHDEQIAAGHEDVVELKSRRTRR
jgi:histone H3/H4